MTIKISLLIKRNKVELKSYRYKTHRLIEIYKYREDNRSFNKKKNRTSIYSYRLIITVAIRALRKCCRSPNHSMSLMLWRVIFFLTKYSARRVLRTAKKTANIAGKWFCYFPPSNYLILFSTVWVQEVRLGLAYSWVYCVG